MNQDIKKMEQEDPKDILYRLMNHIAELLNLNLDQEFCIGYKFAGEIKDLEYSLCKITERGFCRYVDGNWHEANHTLIRLLQGMYYIKERYKYKKSEE